MGQRQDKKLSREIRREARKVVKRNEDLIQSSMRPKPEWIPMEAWLWAIGFFMKVPRRKDARVHAIEWTIRLSLVAIVALAVRGAFALFGV